MPLQATSGAASYDAFGGGVPVVPNYIEDVFSTYLYTGTGATQTITNGIDLSTKGGFVWLKSRSAAGSHALFDTVRGATKKLYSNLTNAEYTDVTSLTAFNANGFSVGIDQSTDTTTYASWTFRKQPKFFDVVTYSGSSSTQNIAHNLGSVPACIIVKRTSGVEDWFVYHTSLGNTKYLKLNTTGAEASGFAAWNNTSPTSTQFTVLGGRTEVNAAGSDYVAYLFAHNAGGFGLTGTDNVISCGSVTSDGSGSASVNLGWEPQWILFKNSTSSSAWYVVDNMRGLFARDKLGNGLFPNSTSGETADLGISPWINSTGMEWNGSYNPLAASSTYIYIAIRRGPMKVPTSGTSVFDSEIWSGNTTVDTATRSIAGIGSPTDLFIGSERDPGFNQNYFYDRLRGTDSVGGLLLVSSLTTSEATNSPGYGQYSFAQQDGITLGNYTLNYTGRTYVGWQFRRAPSFFDVVCYTGTGSTRTVTHNLTVVPELMIVKVRNDARDWLVYSSGLTTNYFIKLNTTAAQSNSNYAYIFGNDTVGVAPTSSVFTVGSGSDTNGSGGTYVAYLFATCAGVSKVGSYTGTGTTKQIDCGFTAGSRFVMIKRTDSTGDWYVWDSARGIVSGNDPYLWLNSPYASAEVTNTDYIDTYSAGFEISSTAPAAINASGGTFIFLAIA